jgi:hypothetical protein
MARRAGSEPGAQGITQLKATYVSPETRVTIAETSGEFKGLWPRVAGSGDKKARAG